MSEAKPHPNDYWIVTNYRYKPWFTLDDAVAARDVLTARYTKKQFRILHCKQQLRHSRSQEIIATFATALRNARDRLTNGDGFDEIDAALALVAVAPSSNGKTSDFDSEDRGSIPRGAVR